MTIDFNQSEEQRESLGAIPPGSMVKVRMRIRLPEGGYSGSDPALKLSKKGDCEMLDCEFEVISGQFSTRKIWNNFIISGTSDGHRKAGQISMRTMRAIVEAMRGISPKDQSPAACQGRVMTTWGDLQGAEFGVVVDVEKPQAGDKYVNNSIKRIITVDDEAYQHIMAGGEVITTAPIPKIPQGTQSAAPGWAAPSKASTAAPVAPAQGQLQAPPAAPKAPYAPPAQVAPQSQTAQPPRAPGGMPGWAAPAGGQMTPPPQFPTQASGMEDVPF